MAHPHNLGFRGVMFNMGLHLGVGKRDPSHDPLDKIMFIRVIIEKIGFLQCLACLY